MRRLGSRLIALDLVRVVDDVPVRLHVGAMLDVDGDGDTVATISKKWFRVREPYGVDVAAGEDTPLILAITVAIDSLTTRDWTAMRPALAPRGHALAGSAVPGCMESTSVCEAIAAAAFARRGLVARRNDARC